jgi:hypothetical protein
MHCNDGRWILALLLGVSLTPAGSQTIGDYSRAQSAALERSMMQAIGRPMAAPDAASTEGAGAGAPVASPVSAHVPQLVDPEPRHDSPDFLVSGVFSARDKTLAEVMVDGIPYWLGEGDTVPRTSWTLHRISPDRVELERRVSERSRPASRIAPAIRSVLLPPAR